MKYFDLDKSERNLMLEFEQGKLKSVKGAQKEIKLYQQYARATLNKTRNINIRLSSRDIQRIKAMAAAKGLPYQTLVSAVIHQYSNGRTNVASQDVV